MRYLIQSTLNILARALWLIPATVIVMLLGTFVFNDDFGNDCEKYCEDLATPLAGTINYRWTEAGNDFVFVHSAIGQSQALNSDMSPSIVKAAMIGDSVYKDAGSNVALLVRANRVTSFPAQEIWDSCDCTSVVSER